MKNKSLLKIAKQNPDFRELLIKKLANRDTTMSLISLENSIKDLDMKMPKDFTSRRLMKRFSDDFVALKTWLEEEHGV